MNIISTFLDLFDKMILELFLLAFHTKNMILGGAKLEKASLTLLVQEEQQNWINVDCSKYLFEKKSPETVKYQNRYTELQRLHQLIRLKIGYVM